VRASPPLIVSMGIVDPIKHPELLIEAHAEVHVETGAKLALVGRVGEEHARALGEQAASLGIRDAVLITGHVADADYEWWLRRASVGVQLRGRDHGESSGAIADCIGAGLPVVTNHPAAVEELGPAVAVHLSSGATASAISGAILELLRDQNAWRRQRHAALRYAEAHTFSRLAEQLLDVSVLL
jgi:glycosyltransferase involved in cell wall biosynthesis